MAIPILVAFLITALVLGIGGATTRLGTWYPNLRKPTWNPPAWLFGPAWTIILGLAGWSGVLGWIHAPGDSGHLRVAALFGANIVFHLLWSLLFFNRHRPDWALIDAVCLWASVAALMAGLAPFSLLASALLLPYLLWVTFAIVLNLTIVRMNAPFGPTKA
jgi:benzodiazapine receptor